MRTRSLDDAVDELVGVEDVAPELEAPDVQLIGEEDVVDDPAEPLGLLDDERDEALSSGFVEGEIMAAERLSGAVDGCERCSQLV
jgi:hypothetical protein